MTIFGSLSKIKVLYRSDYSLDLWGIPYQMRRDVGQQPRDILPKYRDDWIWLGSCGSYGHGWSRLSDERIKEIESFLEPLRKKGLVPGNPHEWTDLVLAEQEELEEVRNRTRKSIQARRNKP
jgi:hypothetical protein